MTENTFAGFGAVDGDGFDEWAPENVSPVVGWLASPAAGHINGQVFIVWGGQVQLARGWQVIGVADAGGTRWTVDGLIAAAPTLFAGYDPGVPPAQVPMADP
jgi:3-oxoacyl-[acyl-carrier protein] reductase